MAPEMRISAAAAAAGAAAAAAAAEVRSIDAMDSIALAAMVQAQNLGMLRGHGGAGGLAVALGISSDRGVESSAEEQRRRSEFGCNTYEESPPRGVWSFIWAAMQDLTLAVLAACGAISIAVGISTGEGVFDGAGILLTIALVVIVTASSDYQQYLQFRDLDKEKGKIMVQVTRAGSRRRVLVQELVVGDLVHLGVGDRVPADGVLLHSRSLVMDESCMTGESEPRSKSVEEFPFVISGTKVCDGAGTMLVTGVGMNTEWGHVMAVLSGGGGDDSATPLQSKLEHLATLIGKIGLVFAVLTFCVLMIKFLLVKSSRGLGHWDGGDAMKILGFFATAVTIVVVAVPEGLPLAVTLSLAFAMKQMMREKALVRHLAACETMGSATTICSDKTGTLTTNSMAVIKAWVGGAAGGGIRMAEEFFHGGAMLAAPAASRLLEGIFHNTNADVGCGEVVGSPTEVAILEFGLDVAGGSADFSIAKLRSTSRIALVVPFSSASKRMGVLLEKQQQNGSKLYSMHWKGASEIVLAMCDRYMDCQGRELPMDDDKCWKLRCVIRTLADQGLRTLCLAYKDLEQAPTTGQDWDRGFVCIAILGIKDPVRPGVADAVRLCFSAGIKVRMVTGDNLYTAMAIARECGILTSDGDVAEGPDFRNWSTDELRRRIPRLQVLARSSPSDKHKLVKELQAMGEVVAVTGDGTNDAPALYEADIGVAMGIAGTEVAKESADIIILDDNFASIVNVAKWGRSVYTNIQKFVQFQATVNLVALLLNFVSACTTGDVPLTIVQLLWVNLIMDTLGALALATEPPHDGLMKRRPVGRKDHFVSRVMCRNVIAQATFQLLVLIVLQYKGKEIFRLTHTAHSSKVLNSIIFNTFVFLQVFNEFNSREMEKVNVFSHLNNWIFVTVISVTVAFQVILIEFLGKLASTTPLSTMQWVFSIGVPLLSIPVDVGVKLCFRCLNRCFNSRTKMCSSFLRAASCPLIPKATTVGPFFKAKSYHAIPKDEPAYCQV